MKTRVLVGYVCVVLGSYFVSRSSYASKDDFVWLALSGVICYTIGGVLRGFLIKSRSDDEDQRE